MSKVRGDARNVVDVDSPRQYTHGRVRMHPDGWSTRLRVHGEPVAEPRWLPERFDLAALASGSHVTGRCAGRSRSPAREE